MLQIFSRVMPLWTSEIRNSAVGCWQASYFWWKWEGDCNQKKGDEDKCQGVVIHQMEDQADQPMKLSGILHWFGRYVRISLKCWTKMCQVFHSGRSMSSYQDCFRYFVFLLQQVHCVVPAQSWWETILSGYKFLAGLHLTPGELGVALAASSLILSLYMVWPCSFLPHHMLHCGDWRWVLSINSLSSCLL
jgi:hypothetical protein